jgi:dihydroxy-acid dehydratase
LAGAIDRRFWAKYRAAEISQDEVEEITNNLVPSAGTCGVMGTASTMACITEALGMMLPGGATIPAVLADRLRHAETAGGRAVAMAPIFQELKRIWSASLMPA